jgi:hypothetical protein
MKTLALCGLVLFLASPSFAQRRGIGSTVGTNAGYGNVVFPGGKPNQSAPLTVTGPSFARSIGNVVAGRPAFNVRRNLNAAPVVYVPYAYPVYMGGYYAGYGYGYGETPPPQPQPQPNITVIYPPLQQPQPAPVYLSPAEPPRSQIQEYATPPATATETAPAEPAYYLLAFKDHSVYSAVGYWADGDTLHYITGGNVHNQVSLSLVDRELTEQLNKGRGVSVRLPAPPSR